MAKVRITSNAEAINHGNGQPISEQSNSAPDEPTSIKQKKDQIGETSEKEITSEELVNITIESLGPSSTDELNRKRDGTIKKYLRQEMNKHAVSQTHNIVVLYDEGRMIKSDADNVYSAVASFDKDLPLMLILHSSGGYVGSAYLIGKLCREYSNGKLTIVVPRQAKSAATLICCAADEIHMGSLSELGPIDPQIEDMPALGLKNSVEQIADLVKSYPNSSEMFAKYLHYSLKPIHLGYYERVAQSAMQYAERLLRTHPENLSRAADKIAYDLVYSYKDHSFVIDKSEADQIFGNKIVRNNTPQYELGNAVYKTMVLITQLSDFLNHQFYFIGSCDSDPHFVKRRKV